MNAGPSGFQNAAVTKGVVIICGVVSLLVGTQGGARACSLSYQAIFRKLQLWRLITSNFVVSTSPELIFGLYLIYFFRVFERQLGSNKYMVFVLFSTILTTLLEVIALAAIRDPTSSGIALSPGPYGLIFASFIPFFFDIPISTRFRVFGATFSDKSFIYLAGLQLLLSSWKRSLIPGICGILAGFTYRSNVLRLRRMKFPDSLASATATLFRPLLSSVASSPAVPAGRPAGTREAANQTQMGRPYEGRFAATAPPLAPMAPPPPPEESVSTLVAMGFDRNLAVQALTRSRNDVMMATNLLLESQTH
ncbi:ubiquitin-associated domain-containing protein 2 [Marchantia polymorpha subsp. ruderalis]|uniref:UBA domain-containing protein n=1 Tax=Marchantia polymorpha TaxID=3197 RepID=A0A2R6XCR0_MARPO|nr:hypothetical protein MARPO_0023s0107 [Marchantia polymorpha]BBN01936.1 hypothetical protein Mp_2g11390 [Marchantia polymorpha subsp. ruderalis]|eukprot:PTQ43799.1 hypothetical protein MARPO_0023s0107 [Marchantia polymorpha]